MAMWKYIAKRLLQAIPLLLIISFAVFSLIELAPYDVIDSLITPNLSGEQIEAIRERAGLNDPFLVRYVKWLGGILTGNFGRSLSSHVPIADELATRIPNTMILVIPSYLTALAIAVVLGLWAARHRGGRIDGFVDTLASLSLATPTFWVALLLIYLLGYRLDLFPIIGMHTLGHEGEIGDFFQHFAMPYITLTFNFFPSLTRYVRSGALAELNEDYVLVQRAFKASNWEIFAKHIGKNIMVPIITILGLDLPVIVTGATITESIFAWPGVGPYLLKATKTLDYPIVMAMLLITSILVILGNLIADILYTVVDPRIGGDE